MAVQLGLCLVLKAFSEQESEDNSYVKELSSIGLSVDSIPVLSFEYVNGNELKADLSEPESFSGIIFTSPRAVQAIIGSLSAGENLDERWKAHTNFAVGKATSAAVAKYFRLSTSGDDSGNADTLAKHILKCIQSNSLPLLFPCGNLRSETLPQILCEAGVKFKSLTCYQTKCHPELSTSIERTVTEKGVPEYMIFFSPSGVKMTVPILRTLSIFADAIKFVAIGPSTEAALRKENIEPYCTAAEPSARGVKEAILEAGTKCSK